MSDYIQPILSIAILDFKREKEARQLLDSLAANLRVPASIVYCHDGPIEPYVQEMFDAGRIDTLIQTRANQGCGIQTRQLFQACLTPYILYLQVDQFLMRPFDIPEFQYCVKLLEQPDVFYIDLAGNQGQGRPSERAHLMERKKYLSIPDIDFIVGGPGPFANYRWTEKHLQDHMTNSGLRFVTLRPTAFGDNGKWSRRTYPCGGETIHSTDEKVLMVLKPLKRRYDDFPNLHLSDSEWDEMLAGTWPTGGKIPEADKPHSFKVWNT